MTDHSPPPESPKPDLEKLLRDSDRMHAESLRLTAESARLRTQAQAQTRKSENAGAMMIEVLAFDCCPKLPATQTNLTKALQAMGLHAKVEFIDQERLPDGDERRHWQSPTLLVNGRDLFGLAGPPATGGEASCRDYPAGVPTEQEIVARLQMIGG